MCRSPALIGWDMRSIVSLIEEGLLYIANRRAFGCQTRTSRRRDTSSTKPIGWILGGGPGQAALPLTITQEQRARHLYVLGATGSGKTNLILQLLDQDLAERRSFAVVDLRGDLIDRVVRRLAARETKASFQSIWLVDLRDSDRIIGFNPLTGCGDPHARAYHVLDALKSHSDSWGVQLEETLRNGLIALAEANLSLIELEPLLTESGFRESVLQQGNDPSVQAFFERYSSLSSDRQQSWFLPVLNKVTPLLGIPRLRLLFGAPNSIDFNNILNTAGSVLLISLAVDRFHSASRLVGSLIVGAIESAVMSRVDQPERDRVPVNFYVDEFESMANEAFSCIVAEGRRFGLSLTLSHQNLTQIPTNLRHVIRNNVQTQVFFQTGSIDAGELRHELSLGDDEDVVSQLQTLPIGQAYVHERPDEPVLVRFEQSKDPRVAKSTVQAFTKSVHDAMGSLSSSQVQRSIAQRRDSLVTSSNRQDGSEPPSTIRHERLPKRGREGDK